MSPKDEAPTRPTSSIPGYEPGRYWVSPVNFDTQLQSGYAFPKPLTIYDSTLRKILYTAGLRPSVDDLLAIAEALEKVGIREAFYNLHWWGDDTPDSFEYRALREILARKFAFRLSISPDVVRVNPLGDAEAQLAMARQAMEMLRQIGMESMSVALGDPKEEAARTRQMDQIEAVFSCAQSLGVSCSLSLVDAARRDFGYLLRLAHHGVKVGAESLNLVDSCSSLAPEAMRLFVGRFLAALSPRVPVTVHVHDDFGLGTATAIAAVTAGAHPDVSVNSLSYRCGFACLEEVALSLELLYGVPTGLRLDRLQWLSDLVAERSGLPNHPLKPITGAHAFLRDLPMWMVPVLKEGPEAFPPVASCFAPALVGAKMRVIWGKHLGKPVLQAKLQQMGLQASEDQILAIRRRIEDKIDALDSYPYWVTDEEVESIVHAVVG